jgi:5-methylcytosine-specific restriction protein A
MSELSKLAPLKSQRIMDLVKAAGVDVSNWAKFKGGKEKAASNPKYCYEWAFVEPKKVVVLNLWFNGMRERGGTIVSEFNMREAVRWAGKPPSNSVRQRRSLEMDRFIQRALQENLPIRVIVCDGERRGRNDAKASRVDKRLLDPVPWSIAAYDHKTGRCILTRGVHGRFVDQFSIEEDFAEPAERRTLLVEAFLRNPEVRRSVLLRACGRCEWCTQPGFAMADGRIFLETHHVIPLGEGGADTASNVAALCPNHHREAQHGANRDEMRKKLLADLRHSNGRKDGKGRVT